MESQTPRNKNDEEMSKFFNSIIVPPTNPFPWVHHAAAVYKAKSRPTSTSRCDCCKKKVRLAGKFGCRCGGMFCRLHRFPEEHLCKFDYKMVGRLVIANQNPLCKIDKLLERI